ncbi:uncharacterized protein FIBRA_05754 [Fibroporia radiculosa]|uniref:Replication protein A subunit n=1 Tax=Fibroporia radiculosa TaxID=599839 RepID=J4H3P7_9APHY|nr:uncharacterized protein FIBRA_05754 [Fibroporia radiculosa]CCM03614.1 predicted protein [Fibroporia radiculosa]
MAHQLTGGACIRLNEPIGGDDELFNMRPTVQFLSFKKVVPAPGSSATVDRYRVIISDGEHFLQAMLATQLNHLVEDEKITKHSIATIEKFTCNLVQDKRLLIILSLQIVAKDSSKIGNPTPIQSPSGPNAAGALPQKTAPAASTSTMTARPPPAALAQQPPRQQTRNGRNTVYPIESLSPYQNHWMIKARVSQKSDVKTWSNQRGEGKLFSVTLMDETGEIKGTGFNNAVDELYDKFQEGKVYFVSKARVNLAKKKFSNVQNEYELTFERNTEVEECHDVTNVPTVRYNFVDIGKLSEITKDSVCDVIGVVKDVGQLGEITSKTTNKTVSKRDLTLVDRSGFSVRLTLWGKQAETFVAEDQPVIAFKGVKVGDFGGRTLSMFSSSTMQVNPDIPDAHALRGWFDAAGVDQNYQAQSSSGGGGGGSYGQFERAEILPVNTVKEREMGMSDKPDFFLCRATIMHLKTENIAYPACHTDGCNKKVIEGHDGWRCERCDRSWEKPQYRYIVSLAAADYSGQAWLQGFNDAGQVIFDSKSADEVVEVKDRDDVAFNKIVEQAMGKTYNFVCRAKQETFNDSTRIRYSIQRILPVSYKEEGAYLANLLRRSDWAR